MQYKTKATKTTLQLYRVYQFNGRTIVVHMCGTITAGSIAKGFTSFISRLTIILLCDPCTAFYVLIR